MTNHKNTYQGMTREDLMKRFTYDPMRGIFYSRKSGDMITATKRGRPVISVRSGDNVITLSPAKVAYMIIEDRSLLKGEMIKFIDGDYDNLRFNNLSIIKTNENSPGKPSIDFWSTPTETDGVRLLHPTKVFVVMRGSKQAVYRTKDYEQAVKIRKEWETNRNIHRWDVTLPDVYLPTNGLR